MDFLSQALIDASRSSPGLVRFLLSLSFGLGVLASVWAVYLMVAQATDPLRRRVLAIQVKAVQAPRRRPLRDLLLRLGRRFMPRSERKRSAVAVRLSHAGYRSEAAVPLFFGITVLSSALGPLLVLGIAAFTPYVHPNDVPIFMVLAGIVGFMLPNYVLGRKASGRQARLQQGLPDAIDLLVVCADAGLGLNAAIARVGKELMLTHPDLAGELSLFSMQVRAGMDNRDALTGLKERTGLEDIQTLVAMILQSLRFGTSIADTLRTYSDDLRDKRLQALEAQAARVSTLMLFPMVSCILPSFLIVILGPPILGAVRALGAT